VSGDDLAFTPITRQAELIRSGELSPRELVETYLDRIGRLDPTLNAFRVVMPELALAEAKQAEARQRQGNERPLLGVPIAIKDDTDVAGQMTCFGVDQLNAPAERDAEVVRRLRAAGAIVIGKTNVPELTAQPFTETEAFGTTRNPWSLMHTPGGSSGGSAAAVAAGLVGAALGSDGAGSIRIPAACCGLFGLKPSRGRVSNAPLDSAFGEGWQGLAIRGPITRTVADAALFLDACHGTVEGEPARAPSPAEPFAAAAARGPGKLRVALSLRIPPGLVARLHPEARRATMEAAELLRSLGHEVVERDPDYGPLMAGNVTLRVLRGISDEASQFSPLSRLERRSRGLARTGRAIPSALMARARSDEAAITRRIVALWDDVDVLLTPALSKPPLWVGAMSGRGALVSFIADTMFIPYTPAFNVTGQPAVAVPAGRTPDGLPLGVQLVGRPNDEATLLSLSAQIEAERPWADDRPPAA
jgi:amidase